VTNTVMVNLGLVESGPFARLISMDRGTSTIRIERATPDQAETAYAIVAEYYESLHVVARETTEEFRKEYFGPSSGVWLAWIGSSLAGCIALRELHKGDAAEIKRMYVRKAYRGLGIAQKLVAEAENFARNGGYQQIFLDSTDEMQAAVRLYERNGYERCDRYNKNPQATIFMSKALKGIGSV
jgi:ribosomal protein S18 acetylase RimI-like enzyme